MPSQKKFVSHWKLRKQYFIRIFLLTTELHKTSPKHINKLQAYIKEDLKVGPVDHLVAVQIEELEEHLVPLLDEERVRRHFN